MSPDWHELCFFIDGVSFWAGTRLMIRMSGRAAAAIPALPRRVAGTGLASPDAFAPASPRVGPIGRALGRRFIDMRAIAAGGEGK